MTTCVESARSISTGRVLRANTQGMTAVCVCVAAFPTCLMISDWICYSLRQVWTQFPHGRWLSHATTDAADGRIALHCGVDQAGFFKGTMSNVQAEFVFAKLCKMLC
jgi:hypothetical protein